MKDRFTGQRGATLLAEELQNQRLVLGEVMEVSKGDKLIEQEAHDNDVYFIVTGSFSVIVNSRTVATRRSGDAVGAK